jgi:hypothetical protein
MTAVPPPAGPLPGVTDVMVMPFPVTGAGGPAGAGPVPVVGAALDG